MRRLSPKSGDDALLRVDGRLRLADELSYDTRHLILLPKEHVVTQLIVKDAHEELGHGSGVEQVLVLLRSDLFLDRLRKNVRWRISLSHVRNVDDVFQR